jgi:ribonucleoside-triphosphate reductase
LRAFAGHLKGATIFPEASMPQSPYERINKWEYESAQSKEISDGVDEECANGSCPVR